MESEEKSVKEGFEDIKKQESVETGIPVLDEVTNGGFPKGHTILLSGNSGTGKTIFCFQWLFNGVKKGEKGLYLTLTEPLFKSMKNLSTFSFYDEESLEEEDIVLLDMRHVLQGEETDIQNIINSISKKVIDTNAKRVCLDSVTAIAYMLGDEYKVRKFVFELGTMLATLGCTTILTSEVTEEGKVSRYGVEEFISDSIFKLSKNGGGEVESRKIDIIKIRGKNYDETELSFKITDHGITAFSKYKRTMDNIKTSLEKISLGNSQLDKLLNGGVFKNTSTLVSGPTGTGKTLTGLTFVNKGVEEGEKCLYISFEENKEELLKTANGFGMDLEESVDKNLFFYNCYPDEKMLDEFLSDIAGKVLDNNFNRIVVDSLSAIKNTHTKKKYTEFVSRIDRLSKSEEVTSLYTFSTEGPIFGKEGMSETMVNTQVDNIVMLRFAEIEGKLKHILNIVKLRGSSHSKGIHTYTINNNGMVVGPSSYGYEGVLSGVGKKVSRTVEDQVGQVFRNYLGPIAKMVLEELSEKGFTEKNIKTIIQEYSDEGILEEDSAEEFKTEIEQIFSSK